MLVNVPKCNCSKNVPWKSHLKITHWHVDFNVGKLSKLGCMLFCCLFKGGYFSLAELAMSIRSHLWELSTYGKFKMCSFSRQIVRNCSLVSTWVSGGSTVGQEKIHWHHYWEWNDLPSMSGNWQLCTCKAVKFYSCLYCGRAEDRNLPRPYKSM